MKIVSIAGPTGSGKTSLGIKLCSRFSGEILSADSRQLYKGADIGTNKIPSSTKDLEKKDGHWSVNGVNIYGYDVISLDEDFSVFHFVEYGTSIIKDLNNQGKLPFVIGGTGFYSAALFGDSPFSTVEPRQDWRERWKDLPLGELQTKLQTADPKAYKQLNESDLQNRIRLIRYLEMAEYAGSVAQATQYSQLRDTISVLKLGLHTDRNLLYTKADSWIEAIFEKELIEEVERLIEQGYEKTRLMQGMIYNSAVKFIRKQISKEEALEEAKRQMHNYIRRQLVWFKRDKEIHWLNIQDETYGTIAQKLIESFMSEEN